jgi:hypothetical protein
LGNPEIQKFDLGLPLMRSINLAQFKKLLEADYEQDIRAGLTS